jgi:hypothetical protein
VLLVSLSSLLSFHPCDHTYCQTLVGEGLDVDSSSDWFQQRPQPFHPHLTKFLLKPYSAGGVYCNFALGGSKFLTQISFGMLEGGGGSYGKRSSIGMYLILLSYVHRAYTRESVDDALVQRTEPLKIMGSTFSEETSK